MNTARAGACLCYVTSSSSFSKANRRKTFSIGEIDKTLKKSSTSCSENQEGDADEKVDLV